MSEDVDDWHSLHLEVAASLWDDRPDICDACAVSIQGGVQIVVGCTYCETVHMLHPKCALPSVRSIIPDLSQAILIFAADLN